MHDSLHPLHHAEAGNHPLPTDPQEIQAALRAGERCYAAHPYFERRYGERGRAFTRSDGGYLASLADHPQAYVDAQVRWLAGVLASRGMPRWLMEEHLDLLYEELLLARPERAADYGKLRQAAQLLRSARLTVLPEADFTAIAATFNARCDGELRNAGGLLVAAVCDEYCGLTEAVPSLLSWLGDARVFSPEWCAASAETLALVRARVTLARSGR